MRYKIIISVSLVLLPFIGWCISPSPYLDAVFLFISAVLLLYFTLHSVICVFRRKSCTVSLTAFLVAILALCVIRVTTQKAILSVNTSLKGLGCFQVVNIERTRRGLGRNWSDVMPNQLHGRSWAIGPSIDLYIYRYGDSYQIRGDHVSGSALSAQVNCATSGNRLRTASPRKAESA